MTFDDFKTMTEYSTRYDESGKSFADPHTSFFQDEDGNIKNEDFDELVRAPVYALLKYKGSFKDFVSSEYFISNKQFNKFYFNATPKMPF